MMRSLSSLPSPVTPLAVSSSATLAAMPSTSAATVASSDQHSMMNMVHPFLHHIPNPVSKAELVKYCKKFTIQERDIAETMHKQRMFIAGRLRESKKECIQRFESARHAARLRHEQEMEEARQRYYITTLKSIAVQEKKWICSEVQDVATSFERWVATTPYVAAWQKWQVTCMYERDLLKLWTALHDPRLQSKYIAVMNFPLAIQPFLEHLVKKSRSDGSEQTDSHKAGGDDGSRSAAGVGVGGTLEAVVCGAAILWRNRQVILCKERQRILFSASWYKSERFEPHEVVMMEDTRFCTRAAHTHKVHWMILEEQIRDFESVHGEWRTAPPSTPPSSWTCTTKGAGFTVHDENSTHAHPLDYPFPTLLDIQRHIITPRMDTIESHMKSYIYRDDEEHQRHKMAHTGMTDLLLANAMVDAARTSIPCPIRLPTTASASKHRRIYQDVSREDAVNASSPANTRVVAAGLVSAETTATGDTWSASEEKVTRMDNTSSTHRSTGVAGAAHDFGCTPLFPQAKDGRIPMYTWERPWSGATVYLFRFRPDKVSPSLPM